MHHHEAAARREGHVDTQRRLPLTLPLSTTHPPLLHVRAPNILAAVRHDDIQAVNLTACGYTAAHIGAHSLPASGAMALCLLRAPCRQRGYKVWAMEIEHVFDSYSFPDCSCQSRSTTKNTLSHLLPQCGRLVTPWLRVP